MKPYASYKASGVDWLGDVPKHWVKMRLIHAYILGSGTTPNTDEPQWYSGDIPWIQTSELRENLITSCEKKVSCAALEAHSALKLYKAMDVAVAMYGATIGRVGKLSFAATVNQACCVLSPRSDQYSDYVFWWLQHKREDLILLGTGGGQPNISQEKIARLPFFSPPLAEQHAIAAHLDRETARVDALLQGKQALIALLREYRQSTISGAVTQGLNPTAPRKPSGIAWLGDVPKHWDIKKIKFAVNLRSHKTDEPPAGTRYVGLEHIESKMGRFVDNTDAMQTESESTVTVFQTHDVLFGKLRPYLAKAAVADTSGVCSSEILVLEPLCVAAPYLKLFLLLDGFIKTVDGSTFGSKMPRADWEFIGQQCLPIPPLAEQHAIAAHLDRETARIDALIAHAKAEITLLKELRAATIADAVLGRVDVRTAN